MEETLIFGAWYGFFRHSSSANSESFNVLMYHLPYTKIDFCRTDGVKRGSITFYLHFAEE